MYLENAVAPILYVLAMELSGWLYDTSMCCTEAVYVSYTEKAWMDKTL